MKASHGLREGALPSDCALPTANWKCTYLCDLLEPLEPIGVQAKNLQGSSLTQVFLHTRATAPLRRGFFIKPLSGDMRWLAN